MRRKSFHRFHIFETLESRIAPAAMIFTVTTTADSGSGSLRQAITDANSNPGVDEIHFNIAGAGPQMIQVGKTSGIGQISSALPAIFEAVVIDGTSQGGYSGTPLIQLDGATAPVLSNGLSVAASGVTIKGLSITHFNSNGISIGATGATVQASYLGLDPYGNPAANGAAGLNVAANGAQIGGTGAGEGNVISGNVTDGIRISASNVVVTGNVIGLSPAGDAAIANAGAGVNITSGSGSTIGGATVGARNVISGNTGAGVAISSTGSGNIVQMNFIGTDATGDHAAGNAIGIALSGLGGGNSVLANLISGNGAAGVSIASGSNVVRGNVIGLDAAGAEAVANGAAGIDITSQGNSIGGSSPADRNVISGNSGAGVYVHGGSATGNAVLGNYVGLVASGDAVQGNAIGISIDGASTNTVGPGNVIAGNFTGVLLNNSASGNIIKGNFLGTDSTGQKPLGSMTNGVLVAGSSNNVIGGSAAADGNTIAYATGPGVQVLSGSGNSILSNAIFLNHGLGIDLGSDGRTANDGGNPPDGDSGANGLQNFPVLTSSTVVAPGMIQVTGQIASAANASFTLQFFGNPDYDLYAAGAQGHHVLGSASVDTDGDGNGSFSVTLPFSTADGPYITATATDANGSTSELADFVTTRLPVTFIKSNIATYRDVDGEPVYVAVSKGALTQENFLVVPEGDGGQLQLLDLAHSGAQFDGAKLTITVGPQEKAPGGSVNVGRIDATGHPLTSVLVDGDLAQIDAGNGTSALGSLKVRSMGQLGLTTQTPTIADPFLSSISGGVGSLAVAGDLLGTVTIDGALKSLSVLGKIRGGEADDSGRVAVSGLLTTAKIGSIYGGDGKRAGSLEAGSLGSLNVIRSIIGSEGDGSGSIRVNGALTSLTVGGDVRAVASSAGTDSATISVETNLSKVLIKGDLEGGRIISAGQLGAINLLGDATGLIAAAGKAAPQSTADATAIKSVTIGGTASHLSILAGHDFTAEAKADNGSVQIGAIKIAGNLYASDFAAGVSAGADGFYGTSDDAAYASSSSILSRIASITVQGHADGTPYSLPGGYTDHFGIVAQQIGAMTITHRSIGLTSGKDDLAIGATDDYRVREV